jgi:type II secretory pathway pseudopilin PulG
MLSNRRPTRAGGFTIVEVMVALGIAASALILMLAANRNSLLQSIRSRERVRLERACESKLNEVVCGAERDQHGSLDGVDGFTWTIHETPSGNSDIAKLKTVTLEVHGPAGATMTRTTLHYGELRR